MLRRSELPPFTSRCSAWERRACASFAINLSVKMIKLIRICTCSKPPIVSTRSTSTVSGSKLSTSFPIIRVSNAHGAKRKLRNMSASNSCRKRTRRKSIKVNSWPLWEIIPTWFHARVETWWRWLRVKLSRVRRMIKVSQYLERQQSIWLRVESDAMLVIKISAQNAMRNHTTPEKLAINRMPNRADSVVMSWNNPRLVWNQHSETCAGNLTALHWCRSPATNC